MTIVLVGLLAAGVVASLWSKEADELTVDPSPPHISKTSERPSIFEQIPPRDFLVRDPVVAGAITHDAVEGTVTDPDGGPVQGAEVYARIVDGEADPGMTYEVSAPAVITTTNAHGQYQLQLPRRLVDYLVDVGVAASGFTRQMKHDILIRDECTAKVDFVLQSGMCIEGWVIDTRGTPPPERLIVLASRRLQVPSERITRFRTDTTNKRLASRFAQEYHEVRCTTAGDGRFRVDGLLPGDYQLEIDSPAYIVQPTVTAAAGSLGVHVRICPSESIRFHVFDSQNRMLDRGVPFELVLTVKPVRVDGGGKTLSMVAVSRDGRLDVAWVADDSTASTWLAHYEVSATGFATLRDSLEWRHGDTPPNVELDLASHRQNCPTVSIMVSYDDGTEVTTELQIVYAASETSLYASTPLQRLNNFTYACTMPRGDYFIVVRESSPFGYGTAFRCQLTVGPHGGELLDAVLVRGGTINLQDSSGLPGSVEAIGSSFGVALTLDANGFASFANVPPGRWVFVKSGRRREVVVHPNTHYVVTL